MHSPLIFLWLKPAGECSQREGLRAGWWNKDPILKIAISLVFQRRGQSSDKPPQIALAEMFAARGSPLSLLSRSGTTSEMLWFHLRKPDFRRSKGYLHIRYDLGRPEATAWNRITVYLQNKALFSTIPTLRERKFHRIDHYNKFSHTNICRFMIGSHFDWWLCLKRRHWWMQSDPTLCEENFNNPPEVRLDASVTLWLSFPTRSCINQFRGRCFFHSII